MFSVSVSVSAVIANVDNEILLIDGLKRGWEIPGGLVENNESLISALHREVQEETGVYITNVIYKGLFHNLSTNTFNFLYTGNYSHGTLRANAEECRDVGFFHMDEVQKMVVWSNFWDRIYLSLTSENFIVEFDEIHPVPLEK